MMNFTKETFDWMAQISIHNTRDQFISSKPDYEQFVKAPFLSLLNALSSQLRGSPKVFRPNRDIRFSTDKRPYKTNVSGYIEGIDSMLYVDVSLEGLLVGTGYHQMAKDQLQRYREALNGKNAEALGIQLRELLEQSGIETTGLKTVPRGFAKDHQNADLLRHTSITIMNRIPQEHLSSHPILQTCLELYETAKPLNKWLNDNVGNSMLVM